MGSLIGEEVYDSREGWRDKIEAHLDASRLFLLLISPDYLASDYIYHVELPAIIARHKKGEAQVLPILLHPVYWQEEPFGSFIVLPENRRPVSMWRKKRAAFFQIAMSIREAVQEMRIQSP